MTQPKPATQKNQTSKRVILLAADHKKSVVAEVVDGTTNALVYNPYGHQSGQQDAATRLGFNGAMRESKIGWYLLGNGYRVYNPLLMRLHSPDSWSPFLRGGLNAYMYCVGDPVNRSDPTGHAPLFPGLPLGLRKFVSRVDRFFFGGSDVTGANREKALTATAGVEVVAGPMRPEKENVARAFGTLGTIVAGAPGAKAHPHSMGSDMGNTTTNYHPGYEGAAHPQYGSNRPSRSTPQAQSPNRLGRAGNRLGAPPPYEPPPAFTEAMPLWSHDTIAAAYGQRTYTVNRMAVHREPDLGAAAPIQVQAQPQAQAARAARAARAAPVQLAPPALVAEQNDLLRGLADLNNMQREVIAIRAANRSCRIL